MTELELIKAQLSDRNLKAVAKGAGVSSGALYKLIDGTSKNPSWKTISSLKEYLSRDLTKGSENE